MKSQLNRILFSVKVIKQSGLGCISTLWLSHHLCVADSGSYGRQGY